MEITCTKIIFSIVAIMFGFLVANHFVKTRMTSDDAETNETVYQYFLNLLGTAVGWVALYYLIFFRYGNELGWVDLVLGFIVFIGITGYLPHLVINKGLNLLNNKS